MSRFAVRRQRSKILFESAEHLIGRTSGVDGLARPFTPVCGDLSAQHISPDLSSAPHPTPNFSPRLNVCIQLLT